MGLHHLNRHSWKNSHIVVWTIINHWKLLFDAVTGRIHQTYTYLPSKWQSYYDQKNSIDASNNDTIQTEITIINVLSVQIIQKPEVPEN